MRLFVAVELPARIQAQVEEVQRLLRPAATEVKWVGPRNFHLTVKFLGEVEADAVASIQQELDRCARQALPFSLELEGLGAFPNLRRPRVVWLGVRGQVDSLRQLVHRVESSLELLGFPLEERNFKAHLTLGRSRQPTPVPRLESALRSQQSVRIGALKVREMVLMHSALARPEPVYTVLSRHPLGRANATTEPIQETEVTSNG